MAQPVLAPDAAPLCFAAQVKRKPLYEGDIREKKNILCCL
jgi:hypothetical protein